MSMPKLALSLALLALAGALGLALAARASRRAAPPSAPAGERLRPCPDTPNCVSSQAGDPRQLVLPFELAPAPSDPAAEFAALVDLALSTPGAALAERTESYARATFRTRLFGFVDDLELALDAGARHVHVRSASRIGHSDLGANRRRVEALRARWQAR